MSRDASRFGQSLQKTLASLQVTERPQTGCAVETIARVDYICGPVPAPKKDLREKVVPILLAAGPSGPLPFPKALAKFGAKTALQIAIENCAGYGRPILVLGCHASRIRAAVPAAIRVLINRNWRAGQLSSLLAALRLVPRGASILVYPVDHPLLTRAVVRRLCRAATGRASAGKIVLPTFRGRVGHPVIFAPEIRQELEAASTAREVVYRDLRRATLVKVKCPGIWLDFNSPASYRRCQRDYAKQSKRQPTARARSAGRSRGQPQPARR